MWFGEMKILPAKEVLRKDPGCNEFVARTFVVFEMPAFVTGEKLLFLHERNVFC